MCYLKSEHGKISQSTIRLIVSSSPCVHAGIIFGLIACTRPAVQYI